MLAGKHINMTPFLSAVTLIARELASKMPAAQHCCTRSSVVRLQGLLERHGAVHSAGFFHAFAELMCLCGAPTTVPAGADFAADAPVL